MNDQSQYESVYRRMLPGDLIVFWGRGFLPWAIRLFASGPSHCGVVRQSWHQNAPGVTLAESTIRNGRDGVQTCDLEGRLAEYEGSARWLPLSREARAALDWQGFYAAIGEMEDIVRYDKIGLAEYLLQLIPVAGRRWWQSEHPDVMVCSAFVVAVYERARLLRGVNWSRVTPQDLCEMRLFSDSIPIVGRPPKIRRFNSC